MKKRNIRFDNLIVTFFGISGVLAFIFMYYEMIIGRYKQLFKGWYVIFITIEIIIFVLGYRSFKIKMNIFQKSFQNYNINILKKILKFFKEKFKCDSLFYLISYIIAMVIGILLFFHMAPNLYMQKNISISYVMMFYIYQMSYLMLFILLILFEIKNWK